MRRIRLRRWSDNTEKALAGLGADVKAGRFGSSGNRMTEQPSPCDYHTPILCSLVGIAVLYLWILPLWSGFWLDECATRYVIHGGLAQIIPRCFISLQSFAFSILEWLVSRLGATSGPALRLPSLAAGLSTLYVLYRLGTELDGRDFGLTLAALFVSVPPVAAAVPNARPYAIAMWAEAGGLLWFFRWLRSGRLQHGLAWMACGPPGISTICSWCPWSSK